MRKFYLLFAAVLFAQLSVAQTLVKGSVRNVAGEPVIGANVYIKGTTTGTQADAGGLFQLLIPAEIDNPVLVISSIGYATEEIPVGARTSFDVQLSEDLQVLQQIVVTGYTAEDRKGITGAVSTVKSESLTAVPVPTIDQALQGRAAGVVVAQNTGAPGEGVAVRVRGVGSINSGNYPLYIVDGIPTLDISAISPHDIQSLTVLKDASAAAVYGARAANGVVVITTNSGSDGEPEVRINSQIGVQELSRKIKMVNTRQYIDIYNEAANNDNATKTNPLFFRKLITEDIAATLADIDHVDAIMQTGVLQSHTFSVSGSQDKTRYFLSGSYFDQEGIIKASAHKRIAGRINIDSEIKKWLTAGVNVNLSRSTTDFIGSSGDGAGGNGGSVIRYAFFRTPALPIYNEDGSFLDKPERFDLFGDGYNPVGMLAYNQNRKISDRLFGKVYLKLAPFEGFTFNTNVGVDFENSNQRRFDRTWGTDNRINGTNRLLVGEGRYSSLTVSNFLTYKRSFGRHGLDLLLGTEAIDVNSYFIESSQRNFPDQTRSLVYLGNGLGQIETHESQGGNTLASFFARIGYDLDDRFLASVTVRRDGSSRFGPDNRWGTFYAASAGWRLERESFLENSGVIGSMLLRAGYGAIGNQEIGNYAYTDQLSSNVYYPFGNVRTAGYSITMLGNSQIKWETSKQLNIGTDVELRNGNLSFSLDYFRKVTTDMLMRQPLPSSVGQASFIWVNNGDVLNRGFELVVNYSNNLGKLNYSISANGATLHNEVLRLDTPPVADGYVGSEAMTLTEEGHPIGSFYLLEMEGIFQTTAEIFTHAYQGNNIQPGDVKYKDQDGNSIIDGNDRTHVGSPIPKVTAGLNINLNYGRWDLSMFWHGAYGQKILSVLNRDIEGFYRPFTVTERYYKNHWTGPGTSNEFPRASWDASGNNTRFSSRFIEDGSYTRLKNLQIGYTLPGGVVSQYGFKSVRIYFSGTNLLTLTRYHGLDPEMTVSDNAKGRADTAFGMDWGTYPAARSYNIGVNLTF